MYFYTTRAICQFGGGGRFLKSGHGILMEGLIGQAILWKGSWNCRRQGRTPLQELGNLVTEHSVIYDGNHKRVAWPPGTACGG